MSLNQKTDDVPIKMSAKGCQGSGSGGSGGSSSSHGSPGGSLQHAKEQLPKYQVSHPRKCGVRRELTSFTVISPQLIMPAGGLYSRPMRTCITKCALKCFTSMLFSHGGGR